MEISLAIEILKALENGADPFTGEVFPENTIYQNPDIVRALSLAVNAMEISQRKVKRLPPLPEFAGRPWSPEEEGRLIQEFDRGMRVRELMIEHKRTRGAIQARLMRLGKIKAGS